VNADNDDVLIRFGKSILYVLFLSTLESEISRTDNCLLNSMYRKVWVSNTPLSANFNDILKNRKQNDMPSEFKTLDIQLTEP